MVLIRFCPPEELVNMHKKWKSEGREILLQDEKDCDKINI